MQKPVLILVLFLQGALHLLAQDGADSSYIHKYEKANVAEWDLGSYSRNFKFKPLHRHNTGLSLAANTNAYTGLYLNYNWLSIQYSWAIPGTELDNKVQLQHTSLAFRFNGKKLSFRPFYNYYNGLLLLTKIKQNEYDAFRNMKFYNAGLQAMYFTNTGKYSYKAGWGFGERQLKPAGGFILTAQPEWTRINWVAPTRDLVHDSLTYDLLSSNPQWGTLTLGTGYNYNIVFKKGLLIISPAAILNGGLLKELNNKNPLQFVWGLQTWITAGYNGDPFYSYARAFYQFDKSDLIIRRMNTRYYDVSLTVGYRFGSFKKKLAGLL